MRMKTTQKLQALSKLPTLIGDIKALLIRRFWQSQSHWNINYHGISASYNTNDTYSNYWFYGPHFDQIYEPIITKLIIDCARKSQFFMDIGANLGYFSVIAGAANPKIQIISIEMDKSLAPLIQANLELNNIENALVVSGAVGSEYGRIEYTPHPYSFLAMATGEHTFVPKICQEAPILRIDDILEEFSHTPGLVKMDIDGAEMMALINADRLLSKDDIIILLEVHPIHLIKFGSSAIELGDFLKNRGFSMYSIDDFRMGEDWAFEPLDTLADLCSETGDMVLVTRRNILDLFK